MLNCLTHTFNVIDSIVSSVETGYNHRELLVYSKEVYDSDDKIIAEMEFRDFVSIINDSLDKRGDRPEFGVMISGKIVSNHNCIWACEDSGHWYEERINTAHDVVKRECIVCGKPLVLKWWKE